MPDSQRKQFHLYGTTADSYYPATTADSDFTQRLIYCLFLLCAVAIYQVIDRNNANLDNQQLRKSLAEKEKQITEMPDPLAIANELIKSMQKPVPAEELPKAKGKRQKAKGKTKMSGQAEVYSTDRIPVTTRN